MPDAWESTTSCHRLRDLPLSLAMRPYDITRYSPLIIPIVGLLLDINLLPPFQYRQVSPNRFSAHKANKAGLFICPNYTDVLQDRGSLGVCWRWSVFVWNAKYWLRFWAAPSGKSARLHFGKDVLPRLLIDTDSISQEQTFMPATFIYPASSN